MNISEIITEAFNRDEINFSHELRVVDGVNHLLINATNSQGKLGWVVFKNQGDDWIASNVFVDTEFQRQGIATLMYQYAKSLGFNIQPGNTQTSAGKLMWKGFNDKHSLSNKTIADRGF